MKAGCIKYPKGTIGKLSVGSMRRYSKRRLNFRVQGFTDGYPDPLTVDGVPQYYVNGETGNNEIITDGIIHKYTQEELEGTPEYKKRDEEKIDKLLDDIGRIDTLLRIPPALPSQVRDRYLADKTVLEAEIRTMWESIF